MKNKMTLAINLSKTHKPETGKREQITCDRFLTKQEINSSTKHKIVFGILLFMGIAAVNFNAEAQKVMTLDEVVQTALKNHPRIKSSESSVLSAESNYSATRSGLLPDIKAGASLQDNLIIPATPVPLALITGQGDPNQIAYLKFGTNWQSNIGLTLNFDLFNPVALTQLTRDKTSVNLAKLDKSSVAASVQRQAAKAYADMVLAREQLKYAVSDTLTNSTELKAALDLFHTGRIDEQGMNTAMLSMSQSRSRYAQALSVFTQSQMEVCYQTGISPKEGELPEPADSLTSVIGRITGLQAVTDPTGTISFRKLSVQVQEDSLQIRNMKLQYLPTVSLNAGYGSNFYNNKFNLFNTSNWYGNSFVALSLSVPLTRDITTARSLKALQYQQKQNEYDVQDYAIRRQTDLMKSQIAFSTAKSETERKQHDMELISNDFRVVHEQFLKGRILPSDLENSRLSYLKARVDYLQAVYNFVVAGFNLKALAED